MGVVYAGKMTECSNKCRYTKKKKALTSHQNFGEQHEYLKCVYIVFTDPFSISWQIYWPMPVTSYHRASTTVISNKPYVQGRSATEIFDVCSLWVSNPCQDRNYLFSLES